MMKHERLATRAVLLTANLIRARDGYLRLLGDRYDATVEPCREALRVLEQRTGKSALQLVLKPIEDAQAKGDTGSAWQLIAAAVDVAEGNADLDAPSHAPLHAPSDGAFEP